MNVVFFLGWVILFLIVAAILLRFGERKSEQPPPARNGG
jgi:hypothetical protein